MNETRLLPANLILEDGTSLKGYSFGAPQSAAGEVVFSTAMTGYPESLSDPSYQGQILVATYPLIGNYGVPFVSRKNGMAENFESDHLQVTGLVISDYSFRYSHWNAEKSLSQWMEEQGVPGIFGVDTRQLTRTIREHGAMLGKIIVDGDPGFRDPNAENLVDKVSTRQPRVFGSGKYRIMLVDCGTKNNIIRCLLKRDATVTLVPWNYPLSADQYDGVLLSNGPGDPKICLETITNTKVILRGTIPVFGICLGSQIMALAAGADTYKLKYGHRSHNQPVKMEGSSRCFITSQNHGYAIDTKTLPEGWEPWFTNLNDGTCEGIRHKNGLFSAVQFHPEASAGPVDTEFLFDEFMNQVIERCR
ncbi:MAG TPA: glutamine-hydrolyzing carbamoyl-phosphate synthase small subunit [Bacteroidales bacterium]|nr:glutamine-hydrolyzing carbamoyl-phosphate synthase small subunit [Bacteroidales bacterium]HPS73731.1 glutamine-hydrolyzing carbamoyl-phosphate synthase small subunit [Bacteroidales bacterium]